MEKDFLYYVTLPLIKMGNSNILSIVDINDDMKLGLYYLMSIYHLGFHTCIRGSWEWISLSKDEKDGYLTGKQILEMKVDGDIFYKLKSDFENGILPDGYKSKNCSDKKEKFEYKEQFGWLSPMGDFVVSEWGNHEEDAFTIIQENGFENEYDNWDSSNRLARDFLCEIKGYVLIHNPSLDGGYIVTNIKALTRKQREFLWEYFMAINNIARAEFYLKGE